MTYYIILVVSFFLFTYLIKVFRKPFFLMAKTSVSVVDSLMSTLEEEKKLALVQKKMNQLLRTIALVFGAFFIALLGGAVPIVIFAVVNDLGYTQLDFSSAYPLLSLTIGSTLGFLIPTKNKNTSSYSELSQLLHHLILDHYNVAHKLFKLDGKKHLKKEIVTNKKFIIVSGLARAGTTSLMNQLSKNDLLVSLNYANMPFITSPNLWSKIYKPKSSELVERSHKDDVKIGLNTNEALEEYFFKMLNNDAYIKENVLEEYEIDETDYNQYLSYQSLIKTDNQQVYMAKNNNFMLRYGAIRALNKEFLMVVLFREPLAHASSLMDKHLHYITLQQEDPFVLQYMNWLGHHEFGINHKPFCFDGHKKFENNPDTLNYWLENWINYYNYALSIDRQNVLFIDYDDYCQHPDEVITSIYDKMEIPFVPTKLELFVNNRLATSNCSQELKLAASELYQKLKNRSGI